MAELKWVQGSSECWYCGEKTYKRQIELQMAYVMEWECKECQVRWRAKATREDVPANDDTPTG